MKNRIYQISKKTNVKYGGNSEKTNTRERLVSIRKISELNRESSALQITYNAELYWIWVSKSLKIDWIFVELDVK